MVSLVSLDKLIKLYPIINRRLKHQTMGFPETPNVRVADPKQKTVMTPSSTNRSLQNAHTAILSSRFKLYQRVRKTETGRTDRCENNRVPQCELCTPTAEEFLKPQSRLLWLDVALSIGHRLRRDVLHKSTRLLISTENASYVGPKESTMSNNVCTEAN